MFLFQSLTLCKNSLEFYLGLFWLICPTSVKMRIFSIYMAALKWTYPRFGPHGNALGFWNWIYFMKIPNFWLIFMLWLWARFGPLKIRIWRWSLDTYLNPIMSAFHLNLNQFNRIIESKVMVKILINVQVGIQIRIRQFWVFHLWSTSSGLEVLFWLNLRFIDFNKFNNN